MGFLTFNYDNSSEQVYRIALIYTLELDFENAIEEYDKTIELDPNDPLYLKNKGIAQDKLNQNSERL